MIWPGYSPTIRCSPPELKFELNGSRSQMCFAFWEAAAHVNKELTIAQKSALIQNTGRSSCIYLLLLPQTARTKKQRKPSDVCSWRISDAFEFFPSVKPNQTNGKSFQVYKLVNFAIQTRANKLQVWKCPYTVTHPFRHKFNHTYHRQQTLRRCRRYSFTVGPDTQLWGHGGRLVDEGHCFWAILRLPVLRTISLISIRVVVKICRYTGESESVTL